MVSASPGLQSQFGRRLQSAAQLAGWHSYEAAARKMCTIEYGTGLELDVQTSEFRHSQCQGCATLEESRPPTRPSPYAMGPDAAAQNVLQTFERLLAAFDRVLELATGTRHRVAAGGSPRASPPLR